MKAVLARLAQGRIAKVVKGSDRGMKEGLIYVEAYVPLDVVAFAEFSHRVAAHKGDVAAATAENPELATKALVGVDSHGEAMLPEEVQALAHAFIGQSRKCDVQHDRVARSSLAVVETFVNTPEIASPNFLPGAWVTVLKVAPGTPEWTDVENGTLDAVSFQGMVIKTPITAAPVKETP